MVQLGADLLFLVAVVLLDVAGDERGVNRAWRDAVHADFGGVIDGELFRHGDDRALCAAVSEAALYTDDTGDRSEVHDGTVRGLQQRHTELRDQVEATDVDAEDPIKVVCFGLFHAANQADTSVVDQNVQVFDFANAGAGGGFVGDVEVLVSRSGELGGERCGPRFINVDDNYFCAGLGEDPRSLLADTARAACYQGCFTINSERCSHRVNCSNEGQSGLAALNQKIVACKRCPRLITHCEEVARVKRRAYLDWEYWGKPVPSFGDPEARLLIVGLAPGAHGANRTGRMFTGDKSGDFLYKALYRSGFASQPESRSADDGLVLKDAWITASAHCAPPDNKPAQDELMNCRRWFKRELKLLKNIKIVVTLGAIGHHSYLEVRGEKFTTFPFGHNLLHERLRPPIITSYHPSQQNTSTGRLTQEMLDEVFARAAALIRS